MRENNLLEGQRAWLPLSPGGRGLQPPDSDRSTVITSMDSLTSQLPAASDDMAFQFLQTQISYVTSHLQIADGKAAGLIAYVSILSGYTSSRISLSAGPPYELAALLALIGGGVGLVALAAAFLAVVPRGWPGRDRNDSFSWVGLSSSASTAPYTDRLPQLTPEEMQRALADAVETCSLIISRKYRLVSVAIWTSFVATALQGASWLLA